MENNKEKRNFLAPILGKFFVRTFISYVVMIFIVLLAIFLFSMSTIRNFYMEDLKSQLIHTGRALTPTLMDFYNKNDLDGMDRMVKEMETEVDLRITVIKPDGTVIADSESDPHRMENHKNRQEIIKAIHGVIEESIRFSNTRKEEMLYVAIPIFKKNGHIQRDPVLVLRLSQYLRNINMLLEDLSWKYGGTLLLLFIISLFMIWYLSRGITTPVREIASATRRFASGDFNVKIFIDKNDELSEVAESFNSMVVQQKNLFDRLAENQIELRTIIASMREGLMVIDRDGKITLSNWSFGEMTGKPEVHGKAYWEVLRIHNFEELVNRAFDTGEAFYEEITIDSKIYLTGFNTINHLAPNEKTVIIFLDITGFKRLEKMKKDFLVNLTHELKTPLTAIKGFVETLEDEEDIKNKTYVDIIKRHTNRMNLIISDMLTLSELEDRNLEIQFEPLNIGEIVTYIIKMFEEKIKEKNLEFCVNISNDIPLINGERFKIEQMFVNLLDNALKYTDQGQISLLIEKTSNGEGIKIQIKNTGIPIPEKSLPRIFERFYVVDKSRSRKLGGTGLGLSIVKHIVLLHKGKINVESTDQEGTTFTITLPA